MIWTALLLAVGVVVLLQPGVLLAWYLWEVKGLDIEEAPSEAIAAYPLA